MMRPQRRLLQHDSWAWLSSRRQDLKADVLSAEHAALLDELPGWRNAFVQGHEVRLLASFWQPCVCSLMKCTLRLSSDAEAVACAPADDCDLDCLIRPPA